MVNPILKLAVVGPTTEQELKTQDWKMQNLQSVCCHIFQSHISHSISTPLAPPFPDPSSPCIPWSSYGGCHRGCFNLQGVRLISTTTKVFNIYTTLLSYRTFLFLTNMYSTGIKFPSRTNMILPHKTPWHGMLIVNMNWANHVWCYCGH